MAQVRKYKNGNHIKKYGTFTIDNVTYNVDDDFINQLSDFGSNLEPNIGTQFKYIIEAIKNGENLTFNSTGNGSLIGNVNFDLTDRQKKRMTQNRSDMGTIFGSMWGGKEQQARRAISALKDFVYSKPESYYHYNWSDPLYAEYEKDDSGNYVLDANNNKKYITGANNARIIRRLDELSKIKNYSDSDKFTGYGGLDKQAYIDFYNSFTGEDTIEALKNRIKNGNWTTQDLERINDIGIFLDNVKKTPSESVNYVEEQHTKDINTHNLNPKYANWFEFSDGKIKVTDAFKQIMGNENAMYNDWWWKSVGFNPDLEFLKGYSKLGDYLYKTEESLKNPNSDFYKWIHTPGGWYDKNVTDDYAGADALLKYLWGYDEQYETWDNDTQYNPWFSEKGPIKYRSLNGIYEFDKTHPLYGKELIEYFTPKDRDIYGRPIYKYAAFDENYNGEDIEYDPSWVIKHDGKQTPFRAFRNIINNPETKYHGKYIQSYGDDDNKITLYIDPLSQENVIFENNDLSNRGPINGKNVILPTEFVEIINRYPDFWKQLVGNKQLQDIFYRTLVSGVEGPLREYANERLGLFTPQAIGDSYGLNHRRLFKNLGFSEEDIERLFNLFDKWGDSNGKNTKQRQLERLIDRYNPEPELDKFQKGGVITTSIKSEAKDSNIKSKGNSVTSVAGSKDDWNLSGADKLQIASIAGDVASLLAAIPTGGNPIAGVLGYGSTATQFAADVRRDGLDWGDVGNAALGWTFDTIALFPGAGIAGKLAKMGNVVKKSYPMLKTALLASGAVNGASGLVKIVNGNATLDDWKKFSIGLLSIKGIGDSIGQRSAIRNMTTKADAAPTTQKVVNIDKTVKQLKGEPKEKFEKKVVDDVIARGKQLEKPIDYTKLEDGTPARDWANENGTVHSYSKAYEALRSNGLITDDAIKAALPVTAKGQLVYDKVKVTASNVKESANNLVRNTYDWLYPSLDGRQFRSDIDWQTLPPSQRRKLYSIASRDPEGWMKLNAPFKISSSQGVIDPWSHNNEYWTGFWNKYPLLYGPRNLVYTPNANTKLMIPYIQHLIPKNYNYDFNTYYKKGGRIQKCQDGSKNNFEGGDQRKFILKFDTLLDLADYFSSRNAISEFANKQLEGNRRSTGISKQAMPTEIYSKRSEGPIRQSAQFRKNQIGISKPTTSDANQHTLNQLLRDQYGDQINSETQMQLSVKRLQDDSRIISEKQRYAHIRDQIAQNNRKIDALGEQTRYNIEANKLKQLKENESALFGQEKKNYNADILTRQKVENSLRSANAQQQYLNDLAQLFHTKGGFNGMSEEDREYYQNNWQEYMEDKYANETINLRNKYLFTNTLGQINNPLYQHSLFGMPKLDIKPVLQNLPKSPTYEQRVIRKGGKIHETKRRFGIDQDKTKSKLNDNVIKLFVKIMS